MSGPASFSLVKRPTAVDLNQKRILGLGAGPVRADLSKTEAGLERLVSPTRVRDNPVVVAATNKHGGWVFVSPRNLNGAVGSSTVGYAQICLLLYICQAESLHKAGASITAPGHHREPPTRSLGFLAGVQTKRRCRWRARLDYTGDVVGGPNPLE